MRKKNTKYLLALISLILSGCSSHTPIDFSEYYLVSNKTLNQTSSKELLLNVVRLRYRDKLSFVSVSGLTSTTSNNSTLSTYVPIATTGQALSTIEPTLLFAPVQEQVITIQNRESDDFVKQFLVPIPNDVFNLFFYNEWSLDRFLMICSHHIGPLFNDPHMNFSEQERLYKILGKLRVLQKEHLISVVPQGGEKPAVLLTFQSTEDKGLQDIIVECKQSLKIPLEQESIILGDTLDGKVGSLPFSLKSLMSVMLYLSYAVEPPKKDLERGLVQALDEGQEKFWTSYGKDLFSVKSSAKKPSNAHICVEYMGNWFYIEDSDIESKKTLSLISHLLELQTTDSSKNVVYTMQL